MTSALFPPALLTACLFTSPARAQADLARHLQHQSGIVAAAVEEELNVSLKPYPRVRLIPRRYVESELFEEMRASSAAEGVSDDELRQTISQRMKSIPAYYDPNSGELSVVSDTLENSVPWLNSREDVYDHLLPCMLAHEFVHAAQDRMGWLGHAPRGDASSPDDAAVARRAMLEGHANHVAAAACERAGNHRGAQLLRLHFWPTPIGALAEHVDQIPPEQRELLLGYGLAWLWLDEVRRRSGQEAARQLVRNPPETVEGLWNAARAALVAESWRPDALVTACADGLGRRRATAPIATLPLAFYLRPSLDVDLPHHLTGAIDAVACLSSRGDVPVAMLVVMGLEDQQVAAAAFEALTADAVEMPWFAGSPRPWRLPDRLGIDDASLAEGSVAQRVVARQGRWIFISEQHDGRLGLRRHQRLLVAAQQAWLEADRD